jgi:hypothetical protein
MNKKLLILLTTAIVISSSWTTASHDDNYVAWNGTRKLTWSDFRGAVNYDSHADAATAIHISAKPFYYKKRLFYDVKAYFLPDQSWCRSRSENLLRHEQLHFDIAELYARKARKKISEYRQMGIRDIAEYNKAVEQILQASNVTDLRYDSNTMHGALSERQDRWEKEVHTELAVLENFSAVNWK